MTGMLAACERKGDQKCDTINGRTVYFQKCFDDGYDKQANFDADMSQLILGQCCFTGGDVCWQLHQTCATDLGKKRIVRTYSEGKCKVTELGTQNMAQLSANGNSHLDSVHFVQLFLATAHRGNDAKCDAEKLGTSFTSNKARDSCVTKQVLEAGWELMHTCAFDCPDVPTYFCKQMVSTGSSLHMKQICMARARY